jgi:ABC-2 type transport system ATP-binding protein
VEFTPAAVLPAEILLGLPGVRNCDEHEGRQVLHVERIGLALPALLSELQNHDIKLESLQTRQATLEDVFIHLTGRVLRDEQ